MMQSGVCTCWGLLSSLKLNKSPSGLLVAAAGKPLQPVPAGRKQHSNAGEIYDGLHRHDA
jgi:hypothetical protein